jgi:predicted  nucleic acid-binding Zn-ribbon protein
MAIPRLASHTAIVKNKNKISVDKLERFTVIARAKVEANIKISKVNKRIRVCDHRLKNFNETIYTHRYKSSAKLMEVEKVSLHIETREIERKIDRLDIRIILLKNPGFFV